jgi:membrane protein implicated in regulation of membrane protease activity
MGRHGQIREDLKNRPWSGRAVVKYTLLQIPAIALLILIVVFARRWFYFPAWIGWIVVALWAAKDIILFPFVWRSYDSSIPDDALSIIGRQGIAEERLSPAGYVRVRGELWKAEVARGSSPVEAGEPIRVRGVRGLILTVEAEEKRG